MRLREFNEIDDRYISDDMNKCFTKVAKLVVTRKDSDEDLPQELVEL